MKAFVFSALMMSATVGFANEASDELSNRSEFQSQRTRAEVIAEFVQARADGTLVDNSEAGSMHGPVFALNTLSESQLTRQQVIDDYIQARADGSLVDTSEAGSMHSPVFATRRADLPEIYAARAAGWAESE